MSNEPVLSVSDVTRAIQRTFETSFDTIVMQGEISNYKHHASGHRYFTLKDSTAQISATMWRSTTIHFEPRDGMSVVVSGKITMFPPQGRVQIECRTMRPIGQGDLYRAFEELKQHLARLGYFDQDRKRALPAFPAVIGVATSASGAALRDILATLQRRMPLVSVIVRPTIVQGESAPLDIANAIADLQEAQCDVMIVGRGGGSIEDLWAFNTPIVAEAIYQSVVPIISAVGHETDFTIADFVADVRAATPTAAAELAVRDMQEILAGLDATELSLSQTIQRIVRDLRRRLSYTESRTNTRFLHQMIAQHRQTLDYVHDRMNATMERSLKQYSALLSAKEQQLSALAPLAPLQRGFALIERNGTMLNTHDALASDDVITIRRATQTATATIQATASTETTTHNKG